jgi:hypothetical protein
MHKEFIQRAVGAGKVWAYIPDGLIKDGKIQNQSPDHYFMAASIAGWFIERNIGDVVVRDRDGADVSITFKDGSTLGIEYQTSLPDNNREDIIMEKWKSSTNKYGRLLFVSDSVGVKELKAIMKTDENIIGRGIQLETALNEIISEKQN